MGWRRREGRRDGESSPTSNPLTLTLLCGRSADIVVCLSSADQLLLPDDPNFLPDFDLVPIDLEQLDMNFDPSSVQEAEESQRSTLSPHNPQLVFGSQDSLPMLNIPGRSSSLFGGPVGGGGSFGIRGDSGAGTGMRHRDELFLDDDLGITVEPDGTMRFNEEPARRSVVPSAKIDRDGAGNAGSRLEAGYEEGGLGRSVVSSILKSSVTHTDCDLA